jgi:hypothetical protein
MKALSKTSVACMCFLTAAFYAWPYVADPRAQTGPTTGTLGQISRALFGERCREAFRIDRRPDAVAYARNLWRKEELGLTVQGDDSAATAVFRSTLYRDGGDKDRELNDDGWLVAHSAHDGWRVSYSVSDPAMTAYLIAEFSDCGRATNSAAKIFNLKS